MRIFGNNNIVAKKARNKLIICQGISGNAIGVMNLADWGSSWFVYIICALRCNLVTQDRLPRSGSEKRHFALNAKFLLPSDWILL